MSDKIYDSRVQDSNTKSIIKSSFIYDDYMMTQYTLDTTHLTVDHITRIMKVVGDLFLSNSSIEINLSNIQQIDSAGVALLIELENMASKNNATIKFTNIPKTISQLCHLYDIKL